MSTITKYPLCWPDNVARTAPHARNHPGFDARSIAESCQELLAEINRLNNRRWDSNDDSVVISTNVEPRLDGLPRSTPQTGPADSGVAVYFRLRFYRAGKWLDRPVVLTCDRWIKVTDNIRAIAKDITAQRARQRWGCTNLEQAFRGYVAIPERCGGASWWDLLGVPSTASPDQIKERYRTLATTAHPDKGGDRLAWDRLQSAYEQAMGQTK